MRTIQTSSENKSALLANAALLHAVILSELQSSLRMRTGVLWFCTYLISRVKHLKCLVMSFSYMDRVTSAIFEILNTISGLVFSSHARFIFKEANLLN